MTCGVLAIIDSDVSDTKNDRICQSQKKQYKSSCNLITYGFLGSSEVVLIFFVLFVFRMTVFKIVRFHCSEMDQDVLAFCWDVLD